jgi:hypothetical protein
MERHKRTTEQNMSKRREAEVFQAKGTTLKNVL